MASSISTSASASGQAVVWNGQRWVSIDADAAASNTAAVVANASRSSDTDTAPPIIKHGKTHTQLVDHYTQYYHHWTDLSISAAALEVQFTNTNNFVDREDAERRRKWAAYYAANSSALAHYHLALSEGREPSGFSSRPESPPMPPQMISIGHDGDTVMLDCSSDSAVAASAASPSNDNRKRKEEEHFNSDMGERISKKKKTTTTTKNTTTPADNMGVANTAATTPATATQPTNGRGSLTKASRYQNNIIHSPPLQSSSLPSSNGTNTLNQSSIATISGKQMHQEADGEKKVAINHVQRYLPKIDQSLRSFTQDSSINVVHREQQIISPKHDINPVMASLGTKKRKKNKKKANNEGAQRDANECARYADNNKGKQREADEDARDAAYPTNWWTTTLTIVPLLVVAVSMLTIFISLPSNNIAQLSSLLLSLVIIITILPLGMFIPTQPMTRTGLWSKARQCRERKKKRKARAIAARTTSVVTPNQTNMPTLREFLSHPDGFHMSFAPAFFGFFAYFGCLAALEEETNGRIVPTIATNNTAATASATTDTTTTNTSCCGLKSVSGASAGAMAAVMLAAGIQPRIAAQFASTFTWKMIADPPGWGGYVRGNNFEEVMRKFIMEVGIRKSNNGCPPKTAMASNNNTDGLNASSEGIHLEEALVPVAVSAFDLLRLKGMNMTKGCMAKAARCSAGFPGLFQPVAWRHKRNEDTKQSLLPDSLLIDGGITDNLGFNGLCETSTKAKRIINMMVGDFGLRGPRGINTLPPGVNAEKLVSIAIIGTPLCGPWAMQNGPRAVDSARKAMAAVMDLPMERGTCDNHYVIRVDASEWLE